MQHFPDRDGEGFDIGDIFADPAFEALKAGNAAFAVVQPDAGRVLWANAAAAAYWDAGDAEALARALFGPGGAGGWLDGIPRGVVPGRPPRLARAGLARGFRMRPYTALIRAWTAPDGTVLMGFAVPDTAPSVGVSAAAWRRPAWATERRQGADVAAAGADGDEAGAVPGLPAEDVRTSGAPDPDAGPSLARRSQTAVLRDRLNHAVDGAASLRLLWRTDATDAVTQIDTGTFGRLGASVSFEQGTLPDIVAGFDPEGAGRLRSALASRATWSGITVALPVAGGAATVPLVLGASPTFGPDRGFAGFRGFGTVDLGRLDLSPARVPGPAADSAPWTAERDEAAIIDDPATPAAGAPDDMEAEALAAPMAEPVAERSPPANVVHLRAFQASGPGRFGAPPTQAAPAGPEPRDPSEPAPETDGGGLPAASEGDDLAFLALGEALRARLGAPPRQDETSPAGETSGSAESTAGRAEAEAAASLPGAPPAAPAGAAEARPASPPSGPSLLLDQLPLALLVVVGRSPAFANAAAAARLGYPAADDVVRTGDALVVSQAAQPETGAVVLRDVRGQAVAIPARRAAVAWDGVAATLWILGGPEAAAADVPQPLVFGAAPGAAGTEASEAAESHAGELLDRVDDAVALLDGEGRIRRLNRRGEVWFGSTGAVGQSFTHLLAPESRSAGLALLGEVRAQRDGLGTPPLNREVLARTGEPVPVPMLLTLGRLGGAGFYATLRDVTALKSAESERARRERDHAQDAGRLPALLAKVSHEIRTPLSAILGFAEVMMDEHFGPLGNPRYRDYLKDIYASGTQVVTLVDDLLDLSRIEAGQLDLDVATIDVNRIVSETVAQMQTEAHRERVIMRTSLGGRLPSVLADERSMRQIVRNLLSNAVKFNEPGGQVIVSTALSDAGTVLLRVRDTGVGMTDDEIAAALEPFAATPPSHSADGSGHGNGLGLPLTRALVGANGASMAIRSRPREGTLVEVAFTPAGAEDARRPA